MHDIRSAYITSNSGSVEGFGKFAEEIVYGFSSRDSDENLVLTTYGGDEIRVTRHSGKVMVSLGLYGEKDTSKLQWVKPTLEPKVYPGAIYRHHKGGRYTVLAIAEETTNSRQGQFTVIYVSHTYGKIQTRDLKEFCEIVEWPGGICRPRFLLDSELR